MMFRGVHWGLCVALSVLAAGALGCGHERSDLMAGAGSEQALGSIHIPLVTPDPDRYRLRGAVFDIKDPAQMLVASLDSESSPQSFSLEVALAQGTYSLSLRDGWWIERSAADAGVGETISASLLTANPLEFEVRNGLVTNVVYSFTTEQGVITFGSGSVDTGVSVSVRVSPTAPSGSCSVLEPAGCPAGQTCLYAGDGARTYCAQPGLVAVGSECSAEQCVAGAQCLALDPEHPELRTCVQYCSPASSACSCQATAQNAAVGICTGTSTADAGAPTGDAGTPPVCGDGMVSEIEQCDGTAGVGACPEGMVGAVTCTAECTRDTSACTAPTSSGSSGECQRQCVEDPETALCQAEWKGVGPDRSVLDCMLGASWPAPDKFAADSCANDPLLACYCGPLSSGACVSAPPSTLTGPCTTQILGATGCDTLPEAEQGACVARRFTDPSNAVGRAVIFVTCLQNSCPDVCLASL